jgi:hypothetical protein
VRGVFHAREAGGVADKCGDFPSGGGQIVATNGGACFEQVIGVALFLAGDGFDERHRKRAGKRLGSGEAAGFADEKVGGGHELVHFFGEADGNKTRQTALQFSRGGGSGIQLLLDVFGFASDGDDLPRTFQGEQISHELFHRADAVSAGSDQNNRCGGIEAQMLSRRAFFDGNGKERVDGNSGDANDFKGNADAGQILGRFGDRDVVPIDGAAEPHGVDVVIGDDDGVACAQFLFGDEPGNDFRGQKVRGDAEVGLDALEHADHGLRVEAIDEETAAHFFPRMIGAVIKNAHEFGSAANHGDVRLVVEALEDAADELNDIDVFDEAIAAGGESFFESLGGADVSGAGGCGEQEDARFFAHSGKKARVGRRLSMLVLRGGDFFKDAACQFLDFAKARQIFLKLLIEALRFFRTVFGAEDHIAQFDRMREQRVFLKLFERGGSVVVVHNFPLVRSGYWKSVRVKWTRGNNWRCGAIARVCCT